MVIVKVQKIPKKKEDPEDLLALFCLYFPQYTLIDARKIPYSRIQKMLKVAHKDYARRMIDLIQIVSAPHGQKGSVKSLVDKFNAIINE